ncbi:hypothetical protein [Persicobacter psychrovividus]|uniref:Uncharacterized protein n=1 Tax=Persicobacter psychrovividus TaxID=387638 RepID=A0ABM7VJJ2_9BACT|nr:hypothetical protein PEPS_34080 [Persicobacter psychrovividus]
MKTVQSTFAPQAAQEINLLRLNQMGVISLEEAYKIVMDRRKRSLKK